MGRTTTQPGAQPGTAATEAGDTPTGDQQVVTGPRQIPQPAGRRAVPAEAVVLLRLAQAGDRDAFAHMYRAYVGNVRGYIAVRMRERDRDAVPDLVQDTFCAALDELDRAHDDVRGWLIQLAAKMCTRYSWAAKRYLRAALTTGELQRSAAASTTPAAPTAATARLIAQALAELEPDERRTVQLRFLDGCPPEETARLMGCSLWTVRQRQARALHRLASRLAADGGSPRLPAAAR